MTGGGICPHSRAGLIAFVLIQKLSKNQETNEASARKAPLARRLSRADALRTMRKM